jgi:hypothetical protein
MSETVMSEYIKGFDHGCDYVVAEIERQIKDANSQDALVLVDLVDRLKMQGKYDLGKVPRK